jgi:hypothetical protein
LVVAIATPIAVVVFLVAKTFLPFRPAALMAFVVPVSGAVGCGIGAIAQLPFYPSHLSSAAMVLLFLGISLATGLVVSALSAWAIWKAFRQENQTDPPHLSGT